jgi:hypothetical protein
MTCVACLLPTCNIFSLNSKMQLLPPTGPGAVAVAHGGSGAISLEAET